MSDMAREDVERLVRIETKLDEALSRLHEDRTAHDLEIAALRQEHEKDLADAKVDFTKEIGEDRVIIVDHGKRIGSLENWRYAVGAALLLSLPGAISTAANLAPK